MKPRRSSLWCAAVLAVQLILPGSGAGSLAATGITLLMARRDAMTDDGTIRIPVASGKAYRVVSPPADALVTPALANELQNVLKRFAVEAGFNERNPVSVFFKPGVVGHHKVGRAADIYAVGEVGIDG